MGDYLDEVIDGAMDKHADTEPQVESKPAVTDDEKSDSSVDTADTKQTPKGAESEKKADDVRVPKDALSDDVSKRQHAFKREISKAMRKRDAIAQENYRKKDEEISSLKKRIAELEQKEMNEGLTASENRKLGNLEGRLEDATAERDNIVNDYKSKEMDNIVNDTFGGNEELVSAYNTSVKPNIEKFNEAICQFEDLKAVLNTRKGQGMLPMLYTMLSFGNGKGGPIEDIDEVLSDFDDDPRAMFDTLGQWHSALTGTKKSAEEPKKTDFTPKVKIESVANKPSASGTGSTMNAGDFF